MNARNAAPRMVCSISLCCAFVISISSNAFSAQEWGQDETAHTVLLQLAARDQGCVKECTRQKYECAKRCSKDMTGLALQICVENGCESVRQACKDACEE